MAARFGHPKYVAFTRYADEPGVLKPRLEPALLDAFAALYIDDTNIFSSRS